MNPNHDIVVALSESETALKICDVVWLEAMDSESVLPSVRLWSWNQGLFELEPSAGCDIQKLHEDYGLQS